MEKVPSFDPVLSAKKRAALTTLEELPLGAGWHQRPTFPSSKRPTSGLACCQAPLTPNVRFFRAAPAAIAAAKAQRIMRQTSFSTKPDSARVALEQGLALESAGNFREAFQRFQTATELDPNCGRAWRHLGNLLRGTGELGAASECFEKAIASGDDRSLNEFFLSATGVGAVVPAAPVSFVRALFDQYAERFEDHLLRQLNYRAPQMLADLIDRSGIGSYDAVLDLGCGTGLAGRRFRDKSVTITGVDLSEQMLARADHLGFYDRLVAAGIEAHLQATNDSYDLVLCCDALIYTGNLSGVFAGTRRVLRAGGSFGFTIESCDAEIGFDLLPTLRYAHSETYVRRLAQEHDFQVRGMEKGVLRDEDREPVKGIAVHLVRR